MSTHECIVEGCNGAASMRVARDEPNHSIYRAVLCNRHAQGFERAYGKQRCATCEGDGQALEGASIYSTGAVQLVPCPDCDGTGR